MIFKTMPLAKREELLANTSDVLTKEYKAELEYFTNLKCLRCNEDVYPILNTKLPFKAGKLIPNNLVKCSKCGTEFEPYTAIEVKGPTELDDLEFE